MLQVLGLGSHPPASTVAAGGRRDEAVVLLREAGMVREQAELLQVPAPAALRRLH